MKIATTALDITDVSRIIHIIVHSQVSTTCLSLMRSMPNHVVPIGLHAESYIMLIAILMSYQLEIKACKLCGHIFQKEVMEQLRNLSWKLLFLVYCFIRN